MEIHVPPTGSRRALRFTTRRGPLVASLSKHSHGAAPCARRGGRYVAGLRDPTRVSPRPCEKVESLTLSPRMTKRRLGEVGEQWGRDPSLDWPSSNHPASLPRRSWSLVPRLSPIGWVSLGEPLSVSDP